MIPTRLQATYRKLTHIPAWLLTAREYRTLLSLGWTRSTGRDGGFILAPSQHPKGWETVEV